MIDERTAPRLVSLLPEVESQFDLEVVALEPGQTRDGIFLRGHLRGFAGDAFAVRGSRFISKEKEDVGSFQVRMMSLDDLVGECGNVLVASPVVSHGRGRSEGD